MSVASDLRQTRLNTYMQALSLHGYRNGRHTQKPDLQRHDFSAGVHCPLGKEHSGVPQRLQHFLPLPGGLTCVVGRALAPRLGDDLQVTCVMCSVSFAVNTWREKLL